MKRTKAGRTNNAAVGRVEKRLLSYGLAAGAIMAGATASEGAVQIFDFSTAPPTAPTNGSVYFGFQLGTFSTSNPAGLSFQLRQASGTSGGSQFFGASAFALNRGGGIVGIIGAAAAFPVNTKIGSSRNFRSTGPLRGERSGLTSGEWQIGSNAFLPLKFVGADAMTHYGWAEVRLETNYTETLYRIGYETAAGTPIFTPDAVVPEPSELALLAVGATGLALARKRRKSKASA